MSRAREALAEALYEWWPECFENSETTELEATHLLAHLPDDVVLLDVEALARALHESWTPSGEVASAGLDRRLHLKDAARLIRAAQEPQ